MTLGKASLFALSLAGSMAVGVWMAPYVTDQGARAASTPVASEPVAAVAPVRAPVPSVAEREARQTTTRVAAIAPSAPALQSRLKPVLASGTDIEKAAAGFSNSEQFAVLAHLSRNTGVPFVLLKHRVLNEGRSVSDAVKMSLPDANVELELNRARAAARADIWSVG